MQTQDTFAASGRAFEFRALTASQIERLHAASLEILARTGARFHCAEALDLFRRGGATVDGDLVRIPERLIEQALNSAPKNITLYNRHGRPALEVGGYRCHYGPGSDCAALYDLDTGEHRRATLADVRTGVRLVDALPNLDFAMSMFQPCDAPERSYEIHQMAIMLQETTKPIVFVGLVAESTIYALELAAAVAGGMEALARRPFVVNYINPATALRHNQEAVERLLYAAERNIPSIYVPGVAAGMSGPMTRAGVMALSNAGQLAGLVLAQLKREGSPFIRTGGGGGTVDMRTMVSSYAAPDGGPSGWALAHYYDLPIFGTGGCSDAKVFDAQAAAEAALSLFTNALGGANLIHDVGYLDCAMTGSLELVAFCDEIIGWIKRYLAGPEISDETLALDVIHQVGPDGHYLETAHTLRHCRDQWRPALADRQDFRNWAQAGGKTLQERANAAVRRVLARRQPAPLPDDLLAEMAAIVRRADADPSFAAAS